MKSLAEQAYESLEALLVTLDLKPGAVLTEAELIDRVGLGRTPVREAVQRLAAEGMLKVLPRRGIQVTPIHYGDQMALLETRREIERLVASKAALRSTPAQRDALSAVAARMDKAAEKQDLRLYLAADRASDALLGEAARNPYAIQALSPLRAQCRRMWVAHRHQANLGKFAALHASLMRAVAEGKAAKAAQASDKLLDELQAFVTKALSME